ncbi:MAG: hypothetical protein IJ555_07570 [Ruminococcus sp.]|nr:hypothetical protein [Ruminococcus sp.]
MSEAVINDQQNMLNMLCFEDKAPLKVVNMQVLSEKELNAEIEKGYADMINGRVADSKTAFTMIRKKHGLRAE